MVVIFPEWVSVLMIGPERFPAILAVNVYCYFLKFVLVSGPMFMKLLDVSYVY